MDKTSKICQPWGQSINQCFFTLYQNCHLKYYKNHIFCYYRYIVFPLQKKMSKKICLSVWQYYPHFFEASYEQKFYYNLVSKYVNYKASLNFFLTWIMLNYSQISENSKSAFGSTFVRNISQKMNWFVY